MKTNILRPVAGILTLLSLCLAACAAPADKDLGSLRQTETPDMNQPPKNLETATFGAGCFWCVEAVLERISGVHEVRSGYMGGTVPNPTYEQVVTKTTGHAEVVQVQFDPDVLPYPKLLEVFWALHDPTTLNRQGNDVGPQYRSAIFYHNEAQRTAAETSKAAFNASTYGGKIVTEITAASEFYEAEGYHQDYYDNNRAQPYCAFVISPKLRKLGLE